jgi:hypothetical protein
MQIPKHLRWEKHAGGIYLFAEYRYLKPEDIQPLLDSTLHYIANSVKVEQPCLHVIDVEGTSVTARSIIQFTSAAKKVRPFLKRTATVGLPPAQYKVIATIRNLLKINLHVFDEKKEAADWIVKEERGYT